MSLRIAIYLNSEANGFTLFSYSENGKMTKLRIYSVTCYEVLKEFFDAQSKEAALSALEALQRLEPERQDNPDFQYA